MSTTKLSVDTTLGILAGGRASRLAGVDKAWLTRSGVAQVLRWQRMFRSQVDAIVVSANRNLAVYARARLDVVVDRRPGLGPLAGLEALAHACSSNWLLTLPVDLVEVNDDLLPMLRAGADRDGAFACDEGGRQPLVALWNVAALRIAATQALDASELAVHALQSRLQMAQVRMTSVRFGNLNTPEDLVQARIGLQ